MIPPHQQAVIYFQLEKLANAPPVVLEDPVIIKPQERLVGAKNKNKRTNQRELLEFEYVENSIYDNVVHATKLVTIVESALIYLISTPILYSCIN
ncbi:5402_t:CDS:2 [Dentiscutata erythropus]|uniref:5402_t:CDS:1 n=1 Tax=Dentiscutata erythropus TaxID=1348616 RepID=A0A9N9FRU1_9GLOM|nr:5402_t:CDS:2 [Dentiscutata erythropus]